MSVPHPAVGSCGKSGGGVGQFLLGHHGSTACLGSGNGFLGIFESLLIVLVPHIDLGLKTVDYSEVGSRAVLALIAGLGKELLGRVEV